jgi:hypothetical protein
MTKEEHQRWESAYWEICRKEFEQYLYDECDKEDREIIEKEVEKDEYRRI